MQTKYIFLSGLIISISQIVCVIFGNVSLNSSDALTCDSLTSHSWMENTFSSLCYATILTLLVLASLYYFHKANNVLPVQFDILIKPNDPIAKYCKQDQESKMLTYTALDHYGATDNTHDLDNS
jgi:hypothetical protein